MMLGTQPMDTLPPYNCGVMVNMEVVAPTIQRMALILEGKAYDARKGDEEVMNAVDITVCINEALTDHLTYFFTRSSARNLGFEYYLEEYFPSIASHIRTQPDVLATLQSMFISAAGGIAQQLQVGINRLPTELKEMEGYTIAPNKRHLYVLEGTTGEEDLDDPVSLL